MVFRIESRAPGSETNRHRDEASYGRTGDIEVEELRSSLTAEPLFFYQPFQRLFPRFERGQIPLRETFNILIENLWQTLRAYPRRTLHMRTVKNRCFFQRREGLLV